MAFFIDSWPEESGSQIFRREPAKGPWLSACLLAGPGSQK
jgi:hypothetical protein